MFRYGLLLVALVLVVTVPVLAQTAAETPAAPAATIPDAGPHGWAAVLSWEFLKKCLEIGLAVFTFIMGLKNVPFFADYFVAYPKLAVWLNAVLALFAGVIACLLMTSHDSKFYMCIAVTIGTFLSAAGIHMTVNKLSPDPSQSPSVNPQRVQGLTGK